MPKWPLIKPKFKRIARFAPLIGIFIGLVQSFSWLLLKYFDWPNISNALIIVVINIFITGGLHFDGLMDTADGIAAGPSKRYEAMKDSRVGAIGVQSLVVILILQIASIIKLDLQAPFAFPLAAFWGRLSQILAIGNYKYIIKNQTNSLHKKHWKGTAEELKPSIIILIIAIIIFSNLNELNISNLFFLASLLFSGFITSILTPYFLNKFLDGHNGDSYGASLLITETTNLLFLSIILVPN